MSYPRSPHKIDGTFDALSTLRSTEVRTLAKQAILRLGSACILVGWQPAAHHHYCSQEVPDSTWKCGQEITQSWAFQALNHLPSHPGAVETYLG